MRHITRLAILAIVTLAMVLLAAPSTARAQYRVAYRPAYGRTVQPPAYRPTYTYTQPAPTPAAYGDVAGFLVWLNGVRAQHGRAAVGWDQDLANWAAQNNIQQNSRGIGHYVLGPARRQNSAMGPFSAIGSMWMHSPGHRSALLDPSIRSIGLAGAGAFWTLNLR